MPKKELLMNKGKILEILRIQRGGDQSVILKHQNDHLKWLLPGEKHQNK
jgi:hypothetical protein